MRIRPATHAVAQDTALETTHRTTIYCRPDGAKARNSLLQGLHSASPRYTPAYDLTAPNGAFTGQPNDYLQYHAQARPTGGIVVGDHGKARGLELRQPHGAQADRSVWRGGKSMNRAGLEEGHGNIRSLRREGKSKTGDPLWVARFGIIGILIESQ